MVVFKELIFVQFLLLGVCGAMSGKELIFNSFYCEEGVVVLKELISTVSTLGDVVVLKELISNRSYCGKMWWS